MHMLPSQGYKYLVQAHDLLTGLPEWRALTHKTGRTLGQFIFEELLCQWGGLEEIVIDNGTPFVAALEWIATQYHICHIRISAYNSQANRVIETIHQMIRDSLVKMYTGNIKQWYEYALYTFQVDHVTTRKVTGLMLYYTVYRIKPLLPFDITKATFLIALILIPLSMADLLAVCTCMLQKCNKDLAKIHECVLAACYTSI